MHSTQRINLLRSFAYFSAAAISSLLVSTASAAVPRYQVTEIGTWGGGCCSYPFALNDLGQVVGAVATPFPGNYEDRGFIWTNGKMLVLNEDYQTEAGGPLNAINNSGVAVGMNFNSAVGAVRVSDGVVESIPGFHTAIGINSAGDIVGWSSGPQHALLRSNGINYDLGTLGTTNSRAFGVNDIGTVVGDVGNSLERAFVWKSGIMLPIDPLQGDTNSGARAVNNLDQVVVFSAVDLSGYSRRSFIYQDGAVTVIPSLPGSSFTDAHDINDLGQAVGNSKKVGGFNYGFLYHDGITFDLNDLLVPDSGWSITFASGINERGQIVAMGTGNGVPVMALLLTPVPEPGSISLAICGISVLASSAYIRRRDRRNQANKPNLGAH